MNVTKAFTFLTFNDQDKLHEPQNFAGWMHPFLCYTLGVSNVFLDQEGNKNVYLKF